MGPNQGYRVASTSDWTVTDSGANNWDNWNVPGVPFFYPLGYEPGATVTRPTNAEHCKGPFSATTPSSSTTTADSRYLVNIRGSSFEPTPTEASTSRVQGETVTPSRAPSRAPDGDHGPPLPRVELGTRPTVDLTQACPNGGSILDQANRLKENNAQRKADQTEVKKSKAIKESRKRKNAIDWKKARKDLKKRIYNLSENDLNLLYRLYRAKYRNSAPQLAVKSYNNLVELFWREANGTLFSVCRLFNLMHIMEKVASQNARANIGHGGLNSFYDDLLKHGSSLEQFLDDGNSAPSKKCRRNYRSKQSHAEDPEDLNLKNSCSIS